MRVIITPLDRLFSQYIRMRAIERVGGCERCLTPKESWKELQCCHCHGRGKKSVRWDEDNAIGGCFGCHRVLDSQLTEKEDLFRRLLGDGYDLLKSRMRQTWPRPDKKMLTIYYKKRITELTETP